MGIATATKTIIGPHCEKNAQNVLLFMNNSCQKVSYSHKNSHNAIQAEPPALASHENRLEGGNAFNVYLGRLNQAKKLGSTNLEATMNLALALDRRPSRSAWVARYRISSTQSCFTCSSCHRHFYSSQ